MNDKLNLQITDFMNAVGNYIQMEYKPKYYKEYTNDKNLGGLWDFIGSYYMGGSNAPDTARYAVEYIKRFILRKE